MLKETYFSESIEYQSSYLLETRRIPDFYTYLIKNGELYSPVTKKPVKDSITRRNKIEEIEHNAFLKIENWATYKIRGSSIWISPPARDDLSAKAIVSEIQYDPNDGKTLVNRNICFEWNSKLFLEFAHSLGYYNVLTDEDLRGVPIFIEPNDLYKIYDLLETIEPIQVDMVKSGEDIKIKEQLKRDLACGKIVPSGAHSPSCGGAFNVFGNLEATFPCPKCSRGIPKGMGITTCPHCGAKKEDYKPCD